MNFNERLIARPLPARVEPKPKWWWAFRSDKALCTMGEHFLGPTRLCMRSDCDFDWYEYKHQEAEQQVEFARIDADIAAARNRRSP